MASIGLNLVHTRRTLTCALSAGLLITGVALSGSVNTHVVAQALITPTPSSSSPGPSLRLGSQVITPENADQIRPLSRIGRGFPLNFDWSPNGKMLFVDSELGTWQYQADHLSAQPTLNPSSTAAGRPIASSPDRKLYFVVVKRQLELLDAQANILLKFDPSVFHDPIAIGFTSDGRSFALKSSHTIDIWDSSTLSVYAELDDQSGVNLDEDRLKFSPDGKKLYDFGIESPRGYSAGIPPSIVTVLGWDLATTQQVIAQRVELPQQTLPRSLVFDPVHGTVAISVEGPVLVWRIPTNHVAPSAAPTQPPDATIEALPALALTMAFSLDGNLLATGTDGRVTVWNTDSGRIAAYFETPTSGEPVKLEFSPDGKTLAFTTIDGSVQLWDVNTRQNIARLDGYSSYARQMAVSPDGRLLAVGDIVGNTDLWDLRSDELLHIFPGSWNVTFSPDGKEIAIYEGVNGLEIWDTSDFQLRISYAAHMPNCAEGSYIAFSPDWKVLAAGFGSSTIVLCDVTDDKQIDTIPMPERFLEALPGSIGRVIFSPNGKFLVYDEGFSILFVDLAGHRVFDIPGVLGEYICLSPDGRTLAYSASTNIQLFDLSTNKVRMSLDFQYDNQAFPTIQFSPDGRLLLAYEGPDAKLWDTTTGKLVSTFPNDSVRTATFSPDGKTIIFTTYGSIQFWGIPDWPYF